MHGRRTLIAAILAANYVFGRRTLIAANLAVGEFNTKVVVALTLSHPMVGMTARRSDHQLKPKCAILCHVQVCFFRLIHFIYFASNSPLY